MEIVISLTDDQGAQISAAGIDVHTVCVEAIANSIEMAQTHAIDAAAGEQRQTAAAEVHDQFRLWQPDLDVTVGEVYMHQGRAWTVIQAHTTQADWQPQDTPALWRDARLPADDGAPAEWQAPTGAHDAYQTGDRVTFEGQVYESLIDANVHSPSAYPAGWRRID